MGAIVSDDNQRFKLGPVSLRQGGEHQIWIDTSGLTTGEWSLHLRIKAKFSVDGRNGIKFKVLPSPVAK